jgi:hypothetical protein
MPFQVTGNSGSRRGERGAVNAQAAAGDLFERLIFRRAATFLAILIFAAHVALDPGPGLDKKL